MLVMASCRPETPDSRSEPDAGWRTSVDPIDPTGLVWASGAVVHLRDGSTIDVGRPVRVFVVAGDGVFFVAAESPEDVGSMTFTDEELFFASSEGAVSSTGLSVSGRGLAASPDGQHLAVLDADLDLGEATMRLFDLISGEATTSEDGMTTDGIDDPVDHLLEMEVEIQGITAEEVSARVIEGDYVYDLGTGQGRPVGVDEPRPGVVADALESPDKKWRIRQNEALRDSLASAMGDEIVPNVGTGRWTLSRWVDPATALGVAIDGPGRGQQISSDNTLTLMTCGVPSGECELLGETAGSILLFPLGTEPTALVNLVS